MLSRWTTKTRSADAKSPPLTPEQVPHTEDCKDDDEALIIVTKLKQENQQLRRELNDAYHRIRSLEENLAVLVVSSADDDDTASIEVQSVMSMDHLSLSSSATTVATGTPLANRTRKQQQKRDDLLALKNHHKANRASLRDLCERHRSKKVTPASSHLNRGDPYGVLMQSPSTSLLTTSPTGVSGWNRLEHTMCSSVGESDAGSDCTVNSRGIGRLTTMPSSDQHSLSTLTNGYFTRVDSTDDIDSLVYSLVEI